jgi:phosphate:Na+ symporter
VLFLPVLDSFTKFLERFFKNTDGNTAAFLGHASIEEPESALDLFRLEANYFIHNSILFNLELFKINNFDFYKQNDFSAINEKRNYKSKTSEEKYEFLKQHQGELQAFYLKLRTKLNSEQSSELNQLISAVRSAMHAVKSVKDIGSNITNLSHSSKDIKYQFFMHNKKETESLYLKLNALLFREKQSSFDELVSLFDSIQKNYTSALNTFYTEVQLTTIESIDITMVINFNRELFTANKAILMAVKDLLLEEKAAEHFNEIPIYKT